MPTCKTTLAIDGMMCGMCEAHMGTDRQKLLLETLRVLKKGGMFAIHDIMSPARYGDMQAFCDKLRAMGYERAELIDTANGKFMSRAEARTLFLTGSTLLVGVR